MQTTQNTNNNTKRKSQKLTKEQKALLKAHVASFATVTEAAESLNVSRQTLDRVLLVWSGSPDNISQILTALGIPVAA